MTSFESLSGQVNLEPNPSFQDETFHFELYENVVDPSNPEGPKLIVMHLGPRSMTPVWELLGEGYEETTELLSGSAIFVVGYTDEGEFISMPLSPEEPTAGGMKIGKGNLFCFLTDESEAWILSRPTLEWRPEYEARRTNSPDDELSKELRGRFVTSDYNNEVAQAKPTLDELETMAVEENWEAIDASIVLVADDPIFIMWAKTGINDSDGNLRDLAASLFEKSSIELTEDDNESLLQHVRHDDNPYASFRSAFALYRAGNRSQEVMNKLHEALNDEDVADTAKHYLGIK